MGAKDVFTNPQFVTSPGNVGALKTSTDDQNNNIPALEQTEPSDEEWHQKYAFIIGLLRKPHAVLIKESLARERDKVSQKLQAYKLERSCVRDSIIKAKQIGTDNGAQQSLSAQMKHLDMMCVTLERQIDVLSNVDQAIPSTENIYSGEPDSLDGTSSEIMINDELDVPRGRNNRNSNFQITINGRSPLDAFAMLHLERCAHRETRKELNQIRKKYEVLRDEFDSGEGLSRSNSLLFSRINGDLEEDEMFSNNLTNDDQGTEMSIGTDDSSSRLVEEVRLKEMTISQLRSRLLHLEKARMDKVPVDAAREIARLHSTLVQLERVRDELTLQNYTLKSKLAELSARISDSATYRLEKPNHTNSSAPTVVIGSSHENGQDSSEDGTHVSVTSDELRLRRKSTYKVAHNNETNAEIKQLRAFINDLHAKEVEYQRKLSHMETELGNVKNQYADECAKRSEVEKSVAALKEQLEIAKQRVETTEKCFLMREEESSALKLDLDTLNEENKRLKDDLNLLHIKVEIEQSKSMEKLTKYEKEMSIFIEQNKTLLEDFNRERILRKKYFNLVEELKGKIRVFCRIRPPSKTEKSIDIVAKCSDPYTVTVETPTKGMKEYQFDRVFMPDDSQDQIFEDTKNLIKSAFDGYNVCICAYGQTGSGKTYTILGDETHPGIAPRTFSEIFLLANNMSQTYETQVSFYVLELYNDKLIDLLNPTAVVSSNDSPDNNKLEIRRDRRGTVWVSGAKVQFADDSSSLERNFRQALLSRHTATTRMNDRSSRSHLIVGLIIETTSKVNGTVQRGKISLVDLAGSERTGKSGVSADTLREANAINKSLSAFGDVINALTTDQSFVPYRNNKLTLLMQDSLGGNAKTLMFVNISPSSFNLDETIISLSYASRVKQVTNAVTRNAESKEIARLKNVINRIKRGESSSVDEDS
ncbi:unnamed protein product [Allacma fusca]|uniref:Kinesin-like protein n=1 Tax=Allacma fusca TaxID=39272 RepID=A0A8J2IZN8_9HEXA|nr:unnamed protein product [Allacma fusca]